MFEAVWCIAQTGGFETVERQPLFVSLDFFVRLSGVQISEMDSIEEWKQLLRQNLRAVAAIGRDLFNETGLDIPPEMNHLFDMVEQNTEDKDIDLYQRIEWLVFQKLLIM